MKKKSLPQMMPQAWPIFFSRRKPRRIQEQAMPLLIKGESVLLSGPTASGKTEAALTPLYQRHISFKRQQASVVYVAPTKALVNDLFHRIDTYFCTKTPGAVRRYTGDHHEFTKPEEVFLILVTPEALDSLQLVRPESLTGIRAVVVDEIHMLHGNARGQQLRHVISRIEKYSNKPRNPKDVFQKIGMTATLQEMEKVGRLWLGDNSLTIQAGEAREIDITYLPVEVLDSSEKPYKSATVIADWLRESEMSKVLVFGNTRNSTHVLAAKLNELLQGERWPVHWHTGVLEAGERERVEDAMKNDRFGVCIATSTLEVGIDIGSVEVVILADPPFSINAFLQRIGRGNRQTDTCRVLAIYSTPQEFALFHALYNSACNGILDDIHDYDRSSVRFQQILSYAWRGVSRDNSALTFQNLEERACDPGHGPVVNDMLMTGALENQRGALIPSTELMDQGEMRKIHTTISGAANMTMVDGASGETLVATSGQNVTSGALYVGGKMKQVVSHIDGSVSLEKARFGQPLSTLPATRGRRGLSRRIIWALAETGGYDPHCWTFAGDRLTTWGGSDYNRLLAIVLERFGVAKKISADEYGVSGIPSDAEISSRQLRAWTEDIIQSQNIPVKDALRFCDRSRFFSHLSNDMQADEAFRSIPFNSFLSWLQECDSQVEINNDGVTGVEEENTTDENIAHRNNLGDEKAVNLRITWNEEIPNNPGLLYARALTSHLFAAAGSVNGKTLETPLLQALDIQDCATLLRDKSEITLIFAVSAEDTGLYENWTLSVDGNSGKQIEVVISTVHSSSHVIDFPLFERLQWLQAQPELLSPVGLLALARDTQTLHFKTFHTLAGLALSFGTDVKAELSIVGEAGDSDTSIATWQSEDPSTLGENILPVYSHVGGSFWLTETFGNSQTEPGLWFTTHEQVEPGKDTPWLQRTFWIEKVTDFCHQKTKCIGNFSKMLTAHLPLFFPIEAVILNDVIDTPLLVPRQDGTVMLLSPDGDKISIGLDLNQPPDILERALLHGIAHLLCGHLIPGDEYGHADTVDTVIGQGHLNRWDCEALELFQTPPKASLNDCSPKEKAMLGLWQMIGEMVGRDLILHRKAERYQKAAYQRQAAQRLLAQLEEYNGAMLCDGVGLGKTYVTTTLLVHYANSWLENLQKAEESLHEDPFRVTVLAPNSVVSTWQREALPPLAAHGVTLSSVRVISHTKLSRITPASDVLATKPGDMFSDLEHLLLSDLVIVDEAHNFRSISARRTLVLRDLLRLQPRKDMRRLVLLLTATPVNNSLEDLQQETALLFSKPLWLSDAQTSGGYRRQVVRELADRCQKARTTKTGTGDVAALVIHGRADARFSVANDFRDDLDFGPNVQRIGDYLKEQDKKLKKYQDEIRTAVSQGNNVEIKGKEIRIADDLLDRIVVQRSRALCKEIEIQQGSDVELLFRRDAGLPEKLYYSDEYDGIKDVLVNFLPLFETKGEVIQKNGLKPLSLKVYMWHDVREGIKKADETSSVVGLQRILVLKRLESTPVSFLITLLRLMVLHAHRLQQLINLCSKVGNIDRHTKLLQSIEQILDGKKKALTKLGSLATGVSIEINPENFIETLSNAYRSNNRTADTDDQQPFQLSLFSFLDDGEPIPEYERLDRLWVLGETLLEDFDTLLQTTPVLTDTIFGKFAQSEWPRRFIAGGESVDWPRSIDWGLRIVTDPKIHKLVVRLVAARRAGQKVIVFSQFSDSLAYIHSVFKACRHFTFKEWSMIVATLGIENTTEQEIKNLLAETRVITGATEDRDAIVNSFAPFYRIGPTPPAGNDKNFLTGETFSGDWISAWSKAIQEPIEILLATDVLAEGVNLQDVSVLVNFDIHWNPVRMIQRSGRIDRRLNPEIEKAAFFPEIEKLAKKLGKPVPAYYWHGKQKEAPVTVNMILPDEIEKELLLRERISIKTLAIDFTLGLEQGTGAEAQWMENYKYHGVSSLNAFQKDRAIEKVASYYDKLDLLFKEQGIETSWAEKLNGWFREQTAGVDSPLVGRVNIGKRGGDQQTYTRYLEPQIKEDVPYWLWSQYKPGQSLLNFWIALDAKTFPPLILKDLDWRENASQPLSADHLLHTVTRFLNEDMNIQELPPQEVGKPLMQGVTAMAAGYLGSEEDRRLISIGNFFLLQLQLNNLK